MRMWFGIAIIVLLSLLYWCIIRPPGGWVTPNERKERQTGKEIRLFGKRIVEMGVSGVEGFPGDSLEKTFNVIMKDEVCGYLFRYLVKNANDHALELLMKGIDAWERSLIYIWNEEEGIIIIRSMGRNGRDDDGQGDDIELKMNVGKLKREYRLWKAEVLRQQEENDNCCSADPNKGQE